ncbi:MAG TPA: hypothetical protein VGL92_13860 [Acidimicrobiia bacterium]|jgi:WD40 repeat protein
MRTLRAGAIVAAGFLALAGPAMATPELDPDFPCDVPSCETAVAATRDGQLRVLDATTGEVYGNLDLRPTHEEGGDLNAPPITSISLDGDTVYYSVYENEHSAHGIWRTAIDGSGAPEWVANGAAPAVSPDGRFLAYSFDPTGPAHGPGTTSIAVRDLETGQDSHYSPDGGDHDDHAIVDGFIDAIAWSPDSTRLAYHLSYWPDGEPAVYDSLYIFDLVTSDTLFQSSYVGSFLSPSWTADGGLLAAEACCSPDRSGRVVRFDLLTGVDTPVETTGGFPLIDEAVKQVDLHDHYGADLLVVRDATGSLDRVTSQGELRRIGVGYAAVSW